MSASTQKPNENPRAAAVPSADAAETPADELWSAVREPAAVSRWLLFGSEALQTGLLYDEHRLGLPALYLLGGVLLYNAVSLLVLRRAQLRRRAPLALLLAVDLLLVSAAAYVTGGAKSPFLGQFYLIIFAGSLFYGLMGGLTTGAAAAFLTVVLGHTASDGIRQDVVDLIPYFPITGALTGYLSGRLREALHQRRVEAERERLRTVQEDARRYEMSLARTIQETALVHGSEVSNRLGLDVAIHRAFAQEVGGDFALTFPEAITLGRTDALAYEPIGTLGLVVGDVSGKGIPAALTANSIAYLLPWLRPLDDAALALGLLNADLARRLPETAFVTMALAEVTLPAGAADGRIRLWSAGHPPAIVWHAASQTTEVADEDSGGMVLGLFPQWDCPLPWETSFSPGDLLVLYSDGLIETHHTSDGRLLGTERLARIVAEHATEDAQALTQTLAQAAADWGLQQDDLTILVCRYPATV